MERSYPDGACPTCPPPPLSMARRAMVSGLAACALALGLGAWTAWNARDRSPNATAEDVARVRPTLERNVPGPIRSSRVAPVAPRPDFAPEAAGGGEEAAAVWRARMQDAHDTVDRWLAEAGTGELVELECDDIPCIAVLAVQEDGGAINMHDPLSEIVRRESRAYTKLSLTSVSTPVGSGPPDEFPTPTGKMYMVTAVGRERPEHLRERIRAMADAASSYEEQSFEERMIERGYYVRPRSTLPTE